MKRRINISIDDTIHEIIKEKANQKGISVSYLLQDSAIDKVLGYESDRVQAILERYSSKLSKIFEQKGMDEAKQIENIMFMSFLDDLPQELAELQNRDENNRMLGETEKNLVQSLERAYQSDLITKEQYTSLLREVNE